MKRFRRSTRYVGDRPESLASCCEHPGCTQPGVYRAPRDRTLREYLWLCLDHVREYNQSWDFYAGLSPEQIEAEIRRDTVWQRQTWRLGEKSAADTARAFRAERARVDDPFDMFADDPDMFGSRGKAKKPQAPPGSPAYAMEILGVELPLTRQALKIRYHALVKQNHPDRLGGDRDAEERLKIINEAYAILVRHLGGGVRRPAE